MALREQQQLAKALVGHEDAVERIAEMLEQEALEDEAQGEKAMDSVHREAWRNHARGTKRSAALVRGLLSGGIA